MTDGTVMCSVTKTVQPKIDSDGNRLVCAYPFCSLGEAVAWYWSRV